jgi:hypothetical protein
MAIARVVSFEDVSSDRMTELQQRMDEGEPPEGMPPVEVLVLHDAGGGRALVIQVFESEDDYRRGEEVFAAMPATDTPGRRTTVSRYEVAARMTS